MKRNIVHFLTPALLVAWSHSAFALDLLESIEKARVSDATYLAATHKHGADAEVYRQARSRLLPTLSFQYEERETDQTIVEADNSVFAKGSDQFDTKSQGFTLKQPLFDWDVWSRFQQSKLTVSRAGAELQVAEQDLLLRASEAYFLVLERRDQLATVKDEKIALKRHFDAAVKRKASGLGSSLDVDMAEARYLEALAKEADLGSRLVASRYSFAEIIGEVPDNLDSLSEQVNYQPPQPENAEQWVQSAREFNPAIKALEFAVKEAGEEVSARRGGHYPTVNLTYTDGQRDTGGSLFGGGNKLKTKELVMTVEVPIFQGFYIDSRVEQAFEDEFRAQEELVKLTRENEQEVQSAFQQILASIVQVDALKQSLAAQQRTLTLKTKGYQSGRFNLLEVLDAQKELAAAQQTYTKARYDYVLNTLRLKHAAGRLEQTDIQNINSWLDAG